MSQIAAGTKKLGRARLGGIACFLAILLIAGCSSVAPPVVPPPADSGDAGVQGTAGTAALEIRSIDLHEDDLGVRLEVETSEPAVWTSFRDEEGDLVVELPNSQPGDAVAGLDLNRGLVESARLLVDDSGDRPITRLVVRTYEPSEHAVSGAGNRMTVDLMPIAESGPRKQAVVASLAVADEPIESVTLASATPYASAPMSPLPAPQDTATAPDPEPMPPAPSMSPAGGTPESPLVGPPPSGVPATQLQGVEVTTDDGETVVWVLGDGEFYYSTFTLSGPDRFVIDLNGVVKTAPVSTVSVGSGIVERVRVAQFKPQPDLVSRVVIDLTEAALPDIQPGMDGLKLTFRAGASRPPYAATPAAEAAPMETAEIEPDRSDAAPAAAYDEPPPADVPAEPLVAQMPAESPEPPRPERSELPPSARPAAPSPAGQDPSLFGARPAEATGEPVPAVGGFAIRTVGGEPPTWEGEPITMSLKDADIKDVLRSFAQISGLNIVVQPGVSGTVTVELTNVPWDQALQQILKINGLDYQLEGNIMRIAPVQILRTEAEEQQRLIQAQALSIPLRTIIRRVSYATANDIARVLRAGGGASVMSARGSVVVDERTNTLIIKELPAVMNTVISVIENLDIPEPQVVIEARIIETTKRFTRNLGVQWGFEGVADNAHGNTTGLTFPNNADVTGGVNLLTGSANGFLDISLGNVLNTFRLDAVLQAAENEGLINILSAPRITTLNNERASIQSGLQIPIQTIANNTVSVQFINATLRLDVTPHVTAAGTVLMDIDIQKREPQIAFAVQGAQNAPIATKDARTRVIVKDGGTAVIGGIYEVTSDQGEDRVPGLSNVPILKHLFRNKRRLDENEELLIFITPRVVKL